MKQYCRKYIILILLLQGIFMPLIAWADEENDLGIQQPIEYHMGELFFRVLASMIVIIFLTYLVAKILRRQQKSQHGQKSWMKILDYHQLGQNKGIYLMDILSKVYLVGVTEGNISILKEIDQDNETWLDLKETLEVSDNVIPENFKNVFKERIGLFKKEKNFDDVFKDELKQKINDQRLMSHRLFQQVQKEDNDGEE